MVSTTILDRRPLADLPGDLLKEYGGTPPHRTLHTAALDRRIPAERGPNGRWTYSPQDVPRIATALGLAPRASA